MSRRRTLSSVIVVAALAAVTAIPPAGFASHDDWVGTAQTWPERVRNAVPADRYEMAGGCYAIKAPSGYVVRAGNGFAATGGARADAEPFFFQATDLGSYLLYTSQKTFLAASEGELAKGLYGATKSTPGAIAGGVAYEKTDAAADDVARSDANKAAGRGASIVAATAPSELADWTIDGAGPFTVELASTDQGLGVGAGDALVPAASSAPFGFELLANGCMPYPEIEVNVDGPVYGGANRFQEVRGFMDMHFHLMAYEFIGGRLRCGEPWHRYGAPHALKDCPDSEPNGYGAWWEHALRGGPEGNGTDGWPTFNGWPRYNALTHEQAYYKWVERAWRGGLRLATVLFVDNHALCVVYPYHSHDCNEMNTIRLESQRLRELIRYIDAQSGGPGKGWMQIVGDPFEARRVMNEGRLAIIPGIETSIPLDCGIVLDTPQCSEQDIRDGLDEVYNELGVRQMLILNKFDNAFSGVTGDGGTSGIVVNTGNKTETGNWWRMETCTPSEQAAGATDNPQTTPADPLPNDVAGRDTLVSQILSTGSRTGASPVYPKGPHCNIMGLTAHGETMLREMAARGMIIDPDHMSARARRQTMNLLRTMGYSGVVSSHSWSDDPTYQAIARAGGIVTPMARNSAGFVNRWRDYRQAWTDPKFRFGYGWGSDVNGFATQGAPRRPAPANAVTYPFNGFPFDSSVEVDHQHSGTRVYDINKDGVAHYGLYPDWIEDLRVLAGDDADAIVTDLSQGPEAYLEMWERALGIAPNACRDDIPDLTDARLNAVALGSSPEDVLRALGQPRSRLDGTFVYCLTGDRTASLSFTQQGDLTGWTIT